MSESVMRGKVSDRFRCCFSGETQCFSLKLRGKQERLLSRALTRTCHLSSSFARSKGLNKFCEIKFHFILLISVRPSLPSTPIPISRQIRHPLNRTVLILVSLLLHRFWRPGAPPANVSAGTPGGKRGCCKGFKAAWSLLDDSLGWGGRRSALHAVLPGGQRREGVVDLLVGLGAGGAPVVPAGPAFVTALRVGALGGVASGRPWAVV